MVKPKKIIPLVLITVLHVGICVYFQWESFSLSYSLEEYNQMYAQSQYVLGEKSNSPMGDGDIYVYSGIKYITGESPTSINFEHPPLTKMLFGASYLLFGLPNIALIPVFLILVISFWSLSGSIFKEDKYRYLSLGFFLLHSTVFKEVGRTMLDLPQTAFLLLVTVCFYRLIKHPNTVNIILFGISSGLLLASKYAFPLIGVYLFLLALSAFTNKISIVKILIAALIAAIVYLGTYAGFFLSANSLLDFVKFEWWRWNWYQGKVDNPKLLIFQVIFLGRYQKWWDVSGDYVYFPHWSLLWPFTVIMYLLSWFRGKIDYKHPLFPYKVWILFSLIILSLGAYEDRFLMPLIPGFALFGTKVIEKTFEKLRSVR
jgi:hypothetical protein